AGKHNLISDSQSSLAEPSAFLAKLSEVNEKLDRLLSWKDTVDNLQDLHPKIDSLLSMKLTVGTMRTTMTKMQESLTFVSSQYDSLINSVKTQEKDVKEL
ncbi:hypothetical protein HPB47_012060, partial [Ixodes persulcatus]